MRKHLNTSIMTQERSLHKKCLGKVKTQKKQTNITSNQFKKACKGKER